MGLKRKTIIQITTAAFLAAVLVVAGFLTIWRQDDANASLAGFSAGNIMSDYVMTNKSSMTAAQIQSFLNAKNPNCDTNTLHGYTSESRAIAPCLKDYTEDGQTAAQIIWQAAQDYNINPQVLIVLLEKEQGLVTDTWPRDGWWWTKTNLGTPTKECPSSPTGYCVNVQYRSAAGYGCPDTGACDSKYYGFKNQIRWAAALFHATMSAPDSSSSNGWYKPYWTGLNWIQYNPDTRCGSSQVNIQNRATAALYNYTPYQPNSYALNGGTSASYPSCGAFGNINFYNYFTDWFGSANYIVIGSIGQYYYSVGGESSVLGQPVANQNSTERWGYYQHFENGYIIGKWDTGYWATRGSIRTQYAALGTEHGALGFPIADEHPITSGGNKQLFENGYIIGKWDTGYWAIRGSIRTQYDKQDADNGGLGFPIGNESPASGGGNQQLFENGSVIGRWDTKYWVVSGKIFEQYKAAGSAGGVIGYPLQPELPTQDGTYQRFVDGYIIGRDQTGYWIVRGNIRAYYATQGAEHGELGFPTGEEFQENGQYRQNFENGYIIGKNGNYKRFLD
ncbi:hypothetical protein FWF48_00700 [Candidatus Saccharibacteria bacterium]|nr:hypothetical protein [Candidatus Saccharibacteria bacterium]